MDQLVADFVLKMSLALPVAILVAVSAGQMLPTLTSLNMERKITKLASDVMKDKIVVKNSRLYMKYIGTLALREAVTYQQQLISEK